MGKNPLLDELIESSVIPQVDIALPTRGYFYPSGEVLGDNCDPDSVTIHPISVLDESSFRDPLIMLSGHAIPRMIHRVAPVLADPASMCELDIQTVLIASRIASHGPDITLDHTCSNGECKHLNNVKVDLNQHILNFGSYTPEEFEQFDVTLPVVGQAVRLRPILYKDSVAMSMKLVETSFDNDLLDSADVITPEFIENYRKRFDVVMGTNIDAIVASIYFVETKSGKKIFDRSMIGEWLNHLVPDDVDALTTKIEQINTEISDRSKLTYQCMSCGEDNTFYVELDPQKLFTQAEDTVAEKNSSAKTKNTKKTTKKPSKTSQRLS